MQKIIETDDCIREITLSGFEVFDKQVRIPLRRLIFLYGPNSSGKSAVEDAIKIFRELYIDPRFDSDGPSWDSYQSCRFERIGRLWRRVNEDKEEGYSKSMHIGVLIRRTADLKRILQDVIGESAEPRDVEDGHPNSNEFFEARIITNFYSISEPYEDVHDIARNIELHVDDSPVLSLSEYEDMRFGVNLRHPIFKWIKFNSDFGAVARLHPDKVSLEKGWLWVKGVCGQRQIDKEMTYAHWGMILATEAEISQALIESLDELAVLYERIFSYLVRANSSIETSIDVVSASRLIPTDQELTSSVDFQWGDDALASVNDLKSEGPAKYARLIQSVLHGMKETGGRERLWRGGFHKEENSSAFGERVNRMLTDHLFIDRGYRLTADYRVVLTPEQFKQAATHKLKPGSDKPIHYSLLARIFLEDSQGRQFSFSEVGSGLGYVLPVLCAACGEYDISLIQQPELHLHPALQAALGDVFIESSFTGKQIIIETHSEHILLRVLKRIRMTNAGTAPSDELALSSKDVAVVYFQPSPEGTTAVKELRVSPDGDFLDRWPNGFFSERDQELFDE